MLAGKARVVPEGSPGFPDGGWIANTVHDAFPQQLDPPRQPRVHGQLRPGAGPRLSGTW